jgi:RNA polymerase sigma-70 factor (ECF subfamily)
MTENGGLTIADIAELGKLIEQHQHKLLAMIQCRLDPNLATRVDPEDILAEAFLAARRKWSRFKTKRSMTAYAWLYRIVLDQIFETWRRETRAPRDLRREIPWPQQSSMQLGLKLFARYSTPSKVAQKEELRQQIHQVMQCLSTHDQEVLWMRVFDQLSYAEIGMILGATENAVCVRFARALRRLKEKWIHHYGNGESSA